MSIVDTLLDRLLDLRPPRPLEALRKLGNVLEGFGARPVPVWYDPGYRLPLASLEGRLQAEPRRADFVVWYLLDCGVLTRRELRVPERIDYAALARVHTPDYLESLSRPQTLARIFPADPSEIPVDELLANTRLAAGATLAAARTALRTRGPTVNLHGGFHHAAPAHGGGMCAINDIAVAIAALRAEGLDGDIAVLDFDAHPPDGTAACLADDPRAFIGSLSGSDWGPLARGRATVDETVLPRGTGDDAYLAALDRLLRRMPRPALAFVIAGGDVLAGDHLGLLGLSLDGVRRRDLRVAAALDGVPSVWLPGGGYHPDAWRVLGGTLLAVARGARRPIPRRYDPLATRFASIAHDIRPESLRGSFDLTDDDVDGALGVRKTRRRLLGYYTAEGIEYALYRYGLLEFVGRLGYERFKVVITHSHSGGDEVRLYARHRHVAGEHLLVDVALERQRLCNKPVLYVHWLTLRNPCARFTDARPRLPGQEVPGLGLAREMVEMFTRIARRLDLAGVAYRPAWFHTAFPARHRFRFVDPEHQGRFEALVRDMAGKHLLSASVAIARGHVLLDGEPYRWEAEPMICWLEPEPIDAREIAAARERAHFTIASDTDRMAEQPPSR